MRKFFILSVGLAACLAGGCDRSAPQPGASATAPSVGASAVKGRPTMSGTTKPATTKTPVPTATPSDAAFERACRDKATLTRLTQRELRQGVPDMTVRDVNVRRCRQGYAQVIALIKQPASGPQYEPGEQFFLKFVGYDAVWRVVNQGTGITCDEPDLNAATKEACRALGLPE